MRSAALAVLVVVLAGCGGSSGGTDSSSSDFRAAVHAAYNAIPESVGPEGSPSFHPLRAEKAWESFRDKVAAASAPDDLVSAKQQLLRDIETLLSDLRQAEGVFEYSDISDAADQAEADLAAIKGDVAGL